VTVLSRYLLRETVISLLAVLVVLLLILLGGVFAKLLGKVVTGELSATILFPLLALGSLKSLTTLMAVALFLSVLVTLGGLYHNNEMTALRACGAGYSELVRPLLLLGAVIAALLALLSFWIEPWSGALSEQLRAQSEKSLDVAGISPGRFITLPGGNDVVFAEGLNDDRKSLRDIFIFRQMDSKIQVVSADSARQLKDEKSGRRVLELGSGKLYEAGQADEGFTVMSFSRQGFLMPDPVGNGKARRLKHAPTAALLASEGLAEKTELQWRLSYPISAILLVLLAIPLSYTAPRKGQFAKMALAVLVYVFYVNLLGLARTWMGDGKMPAWMGLWWVHLLLLLFAVMLLVRQYGWRWLLGKR
jgi:lipopolysaccharide export system permease protein